MNAPAEKKPAAAAKDPFIDLAERIFVNLAARIYSAPSAPDQKKPDPKTLAAMCFKMAEAFEAATKETDRAKAATEIANKAAVRLDEVDLSSVFAASSAKK
jgi:hypothetical protein